jgi:hypothetical protein
LKDITLLSHLFIESGLTPADQEAASAITRAAHENRKKVIIAGLFIEREIEAIIAFYLFPNSGEDQRRTFMISEILGSDALSFSKKKRLIISLVNQNNWLKSNEKDSFDKDLATMLKRRNAFAHGNIIVRDSAAFIEYFEGSRKKDELTDSYWSGLEESFYSLVKRIELVKAAAGMHTTDAATPPNTR